MGKRMVLDSLVALALVVAASAPAALSSAPVAAVSAPDHVEASIDNFSFDPATLEVRAGTTVTWTNEDDIPHTVVSNDKVFASPVLDTGGKFSYTFQKAGTFGYYCSIHPKMTGKVIVK